MRVAIFGAGRVGPVSGTWLAEVGHEAVCADIGQDRIDCPACRGIGCGRSVRAW